MAPAIIPLERAARPRITTKRTGPAPVLERLHAELVRVREMQRRTTQELDAIRQRALAQDKLALLGQHAACAAHEMNQPLFYLKIFCESVLKDTGAGTTLPAGVNDEAREACRQIERMTALTRQIQRFSRSEAGPPSTQEVPQALARALCLMAPRLRQAGVRLSETGAAGLPPILGSGGMLEQLFVNLVHNAIDALAGQGQKRILIRFSKENGHLVVTFRDNGPGVPEAIRERIFDPFFTTKPTGQGTGLGLAICADIVRVHQGSMVLNSQRKRGAEFVIRLPHLRGREGQTGGHGAAAITPSGDKPPGNK
jgi:two-component system C4-dicarboxylate transport sensor histidine kinase DctB